MFNSIASQSRRIAQEGSPQDFSDLVRAFATVKLQNNELFGCIAAQATRIAIDGEIRDLSNTVAAYAKVQYRAAELFSVVASQIDRIVKDGDPHDFALIASAYAINDHNSSELFSRLAEEKSGVIATKGSFQQVSDILEAYAKNGFISTKIIFAVTQQQQRLLNFAMKDKMNSNHIAKFLWAIAISGHLRLNNTYLETMVKTLWNFALSPTFLKTAKDGSLLQLFQVSRKKTKQKNYEKRSDECYCYASWLRSLWIAKRRVLLLRFVAFRIIGSLSDYVPSLRKKKINKNNHEERSERPARANRRVLLSPLHVAPRGSLSGECFLCASPLRSSF